jgi:hypothetical protein
MDLCTEDPLIGMQMSMQTSESPNMATATPIGSPRAQTPQKQRAGLLKLDSQPSAATSRPSSLRARRGRSLPGVVSSHSGHLRGIGPLTSNLQGS